MFSNLLESSRHIECKHDRRITLGFSNPLIPKFVFKITPPPPPPLQVHTSFPLLEFLVEMVNVVIFILLKAA